MAHQIANGSRRMSKVAVALAVGIALIGASQSWADEHEPVSEGAHGHSEMEMDHESMEGSSEGPVSGEAQRGGEDESDHEKMRGSTGDGPVSEDAHGHGSN
ncbi:MAG: hypothetical protein CMM50_06905 [Rhodospirillaceae bacterium]|nr:hypothetical protein [Rhodospirillaceae bacterium]